MESGRRYFRAIEHEGGWHCRQGSSVIDGHDDMDDALAHLSVLASADRPSQVFVHYLDGSVLSVATFD
ncbi:MAG: hypothetical protein ACXVGO_12150 [Mycobacterium sp.]